MDFASFGRHSTVLLSRCKGQCERYFLESPKKPRDKNPELQEMLQGSVAWPRWWLSLVPRRFPCVDLLTQPGSLHGCGLCVFCDGPLTEKSGVNGGQSGVPGLGSLHWLAALGRAGMIFPTEGGARRGLEFRETRRPRPVKKGARFFVSPFWTDELMSAAGSNVSREPSYPSLT